MLWCLEHLEVLIMLKQNFCKWLKSSKAHLKVLVLEALYLVLELITQVELASNQLRLYFLAVVHLCCVAVIIDIYSLLQACVVLVCKIWTYLE